MKELLHFFPEQAGINRHGQNDMSPGPLAPRTAGEVVLADHDDEDFLEGSAIAR